MQRARAASVVADATNLSLGSLASYLLVTNVLAHLYFISNADAVLGGMWAVTATIFVNRASYRESVIAVVSRVAARRTARTGQGVSVPAWVVRLLGGLGRTGRSSPNLQMIMGCCFA